MVALFEAAVRRLHSTEWRRSLSAFTRAAIVATHAERDRAPPQVSENK